MIVNANGPKPKRAPKVGDVLIEGRKRFRMIGHCPCCARPRWKRVAVDVSAAGRKS